MERRTFIAVVSGGLLAAPLAAETQPPPRKTARIGYLSWLAGPSHLEDAFRHGLRDQGYVEGQNIAIEYRWADSRPDRAAAFAAELVRLQVDIIVSTGGSIPAFAAKRATTTIPIVFNSGSRVENGLVTRLDRPGKNLTGIDNFASELNVKRLQLLTEAVPRVARVAVLVNPQTGPATGARLKELEDAAQALRVELHVQEARALQEIDHAFTAIARERSQALLEMNDPMFWAQRKRIVDLTAKHRLPGIFQSREFAEAGGLLSYAPSFADIMRRLAIYVVKIRQGAKPADLPIEQPTKFELVIKPQDREGPRPDDPAVAPAAGGSCD